MEIYVLDMGQTKFGDCILITKGNSKILIDGAHSGDYESIKAQLTGILKKGLPFKIDLLVVTHCHLDHIGCLPKLVKNGDIQVTTALVADEKMGFGRTANGDGPADAVFTPEQKTLVTALMEEDHSDLPPDALEAFLQDAGSLEDSYKFMLKQLTNSGTKVVRYKGSDNTPELKSIETKFKSFGLKILGPAKDHLLICTHKLAVGGDAVADLINKNTSDDLSTEDLAVTYKSMMNMAMDDAAIADASNSGAAKNDQSIVLKVKADGWSALLTADMQFAKSQVGGLDAFMTQLLKDVNTAGPYDFIKLGHHSSDNAVNDIMLDDWNKQTKLFAHTGGANDPTHPDKDTLKLLKARAAKLSFARTDRNGIITVKKKGAKLQMEISKGKTNDFSVNQDVLMQPVAQPEKTVEVFSNQPVTEKVTTSDDTVEVITRVPHVSTRVTVTIEIDGEKKKSITVSDPAITAGRLDNVVFITSKSALNRNIGNDQTTGLFNYLEKIKNTSIVDLPAGIQDAGAAAELVRKQAAKNTKGFVIIGGYDVVPGLRMDVIDKALRQKLKREGKDDLDADDFIVWTDDIYGDRDGDIMPELPVSRIPDASRADLLYNALRAPMFRKSSRFGVRNIARPFAKDIFEIVPGGSSILEISEKFGPANAGQAALGAVYYMLHGSHADATRFWGETKDGDEYEAINITSIPKTAPGTIVFTGCCWGALSTYPPANMKTPDIPLQQKKPGESIALSYLLAGALAFVGCTGSHYSPLAPPYNYFGKPMHDNFWKAITAGKAPAEALFYAKKEYAKKIPHGQMESFNQAVEAKILWQFTCLGLGW